MYYSFDPVDDWNKYSWSLDDKKQQEPEDPFEDRMEKFWDNIDWALISYIKKNKYAKHRIID